MKTWLIAGVIIAIIVVSSGAGLYLYSVNLPPEAQTKTIIDSTGASVEVPINVDRVVALRSGIIEMMIVLGAEDKLVGVDEQTVVGTGYGEFNARLCPQLMDLTAPVSGKTVNVEQVIALDPDVILIGGYGRLSWIDPLKAANLTVVVTHFEEIGNFTRDLNILAQVIGKENEANAVTPHVQGVLDKVESRVGDLPTAEQVTAYFCSHDIYHVYGSTTFEHAQIVQANGVNVAESITTWLPEVSPEQLLLWNPEIIFTLEGTSLEDILSDTRIQDVSAIKNGKVYSIAECGWDFGSLRALFSIEWMASKLYPDKFSDLDMTQEANSFYQAVYGVDYTGPSL
ncbi:ABC transporter substrate-binding protein [Candidatus Bathyarchaeota archaeon]|nr:ABC transporter substrate-binding protein [Candidatus Bathyarchaeota archaeon]